MITKSELKQVFGDLYIEYYKGKANEGDDVIRIFGKCEDMRTLQRSDCDFNYGATYIGCLATGALSGPFVAPVMVLCVSGATAIFMNCYSSADKAYLICVN